MYTTEKLARRAARKAGHADGTYDVVPTEDGKFNFVPKAATPETPESEPAPDHVVEQPSPEQGAGEPPVELTEGQNEQLGSSEGDVPSEEPETPETPVEAPKAIVIHMPDGVGLDKPVAFVWAFLSANPDLSRKNQLAALIAMGMNPNTMRTQTSRYYKAGGVKAAYLAAEKVKRETEKAKIEALVAEIMKKRAEEAKGEEPKADNGTTEGQPAA